MKKRILSIMIMLLISIPLIIIGGFPFQIMVILIGIEMLKELLDVKKVPKLVQYTTYGLTLLLFLHGYSIKILSIIIMILFLFVIYYYDNKKYSVVDAFYTVSGLFLIFITCYYVIQLRNKNFPILIYLLLITTMTDTYAYIVGCLIGNHKLIENISPKKTVEGLIGGLFGGVLIASIFYMINFRNIYLPSLLFQTTILSLLGQFGDLFFSSLKREYHIKDYSNLIPGHGGMLDRFDSLIFVLIGYLIFI